MKDKAYAKINISLDIVGKREDGYHLLEMIMQNIELYDEIELQKKNFGIQIICDKPFVPTDERNLAYKAAEAFIEHYNIKSGVKIRIIKNIPVSAGLAGGSTDCAAVLKMMNKLFKVNATDEELMEIGVKLGADVPYCIKGVTALCKGIGEEIIELKPFKNKLVVLVKPPFAVSTKEVYKNFDMNKAKKHPNTEQLIKYMEEDDLLNVADNMKNLLENVTLKKHKVLFNIKKNMQKHGALGTMMSGSGPSIFAFFDDIFKAQQCYDDMKKHYKDVFLTRTN